LERLLDDSLEVPGLFSAGQLGEEACPGITLPRHVVHFEAFEIVDKSFGNMIVLEQHCLLGLVYVGNLSLDKLRVGIAS